MSSIDMALVIAQINDAIIFCNKNGKNPKDITVEIGFESYKTLLEETPLTEIKNIRGVDIIVDQKVANKLLINIP